MTRTNVIAVRTFEAPNGICGCLLVEADDGTSAYEIRDELQRVASDVAKRVNAPVFKDLVDAATDVCLMRGWKLSSAMFDEIMF